MNKLIRINGRLADVKECKKFLYEKHDHWELVRLDYMNKEGVIYRSDALIEGAKVAILEKLLLEKGVDKKLLDQFVDAVRAEERRDQAEADAGEDL
jgi:hypothetical protein